MASPYDETGAVSQSLVKVVRQVGELKETGLPEPNLGENLSDLHNRLLVTRAHQTTVTAHIGNLIRLRAGVRKKRMDLQGALEGAEAAAVTEKRWTTEDYSSAKEKNALLASKTLQERIDLRAIEKLNEDVEAALAYARTIHTELGAQVQDVNSRLRILTLEANLG